MLKIKYNNYFTTFVLLDWLDTPPPKKKRFFLFSSHCFDTPPHQALHWKLAINLIPWGIWKKSKISIKIGFSKNHLYLISKLFWWAFRSQKSYFYILSFFINLPRNFRIWWNVKFWSNYLFWSILLNRYTPRFFSSQFFVFHFLL